MGKYAFISLEKARKSLENNNIDVLVTAPINKSMIQENHKEFIGHTEYLEKNFEGKSLMMMISDNMKIACSTSHIPLSEVPKSLTQEKIVQDLKIINDLANKISHAELNKKKDIRFTNIKNCIFINLPK